MDFFKSRFWHFTVEISKKKNATTVKYLNDCSVTYDLKIFLFVKIFPLTFLPYVYRYKRVATHILRVASVRCPGAVPWRLLRRRSCRCLGVGCTAVLHDHRTHAFPSWLHSRPQEKHIARRHQCSSPFVSAMQDTCAWVSAWNSFINFVCSLR